MSFLDRRVVMAFKAHHLPDELYIGTTQKDSDVNSSIRARFCYRTEDKLRIRIIPTFTLQTEGGKPTLLRSGALTIVPVTRTGANQITSLRIYKKNDADVPAMPSRLNCGQDTAGFKWSHYMQCSFSGCYWTNRGSADLSPPLQQVWDRLSGLRLGGTIRIWIKEVGSNDVCFTEFMQNMGSASIPWLRYRSVGSSAHWIEFTGQLPPLPLRVKKDGSKEVDREIAVVQFFDLHDYEVRLGVAIKRDDAYQVAQLRAYEGVEHSIAIRALQGVSDGYVYALVKVDKSTQEAGKMPSPGTGFQIDWRMPGHTSKDAQSPPWQGRVIHKPYWTSPDIDFVMVTRQPIGGQLPHMDGGDASLSAVYGHASSHRKLSAIHRLCYPEMKSPMLSRLRTILLGYNLTNLETVDLCHGHSNWQQLPQVQAAVNSLNEFQRNAMLHALCAPGGIGIITGPPGTGKTHLIIALTKVLSALGHKVLLCAPSNDSTNHLAGAIHRKHPELGVIRVYRSTAEESYIKSGMTHGEDEHVDAEEDVLVFRTMDVISTLAQIRGDKRGTMAHKELCLTAHCIRKAKQIQEQSRQHNPFSGEECKLPNVDAFLEVLRLYDDKHRPSKQQLKESGKQLREVSKSVMASASVLVTTCNGGYGEEIRQFYSPDVVVFDEAAHTDEPDTLIALTRESVKAIVLVGDINQLQPVVVSNQENEFGPQLQCSMQSRLMQAGYPSYGLRIQYRMLPAISDWPNRTFYNGDFIDDQSTHLDQRPLASEFSNCLATTWGIPPTNCLMVQTSVRHTITGSNGSLTNYPHINTVLSMVKQLVAATTIKPSQISIISLYELQRLNYGHVLETLRMTNPLIRPLLEGVEVATVDSFQGKENEIVFLDLVTVGGPKGVGFVRDAKRLNVGTTRAKCGLVIVGYEYMLGDRWKQDMHKYLNSMVTYIRAKKQIVTIGVTEDYTTVLGSGQIPYEAVEYPGFEPSKPKRPRDQSPGISDQQTSTRGRRRKVLHQQTLTLPLRTPAGPYDDQTGQAKGKGREIDVERSNPPQSSQQTDERAVTDRGVGAEALGGAENLGIQANESMETAMGTADATMAEDSLTDTGTNVSIYANAGQLTDFPGDADWFESLEISLARMD
ncbi:MAG: hypothetical protein M1839_004561 [Geoglossum umbratile]|nr:MAG: hypothetical protein M1839_004561 [Geoglossum umbratile]